MPGCASSAAARSGTARSALRRTVSLLKSQTALWQDQPAPADRSFAPRARPSRATRRKPLTQASARGPQSSQSSPTTPTAGSPRRRTRSISDIDIPPIAHQLTTSVRNSARCRSRTLALWRSSAIRSLRSCAGSRGRASRCAARGARRRRARDPPADPGPGSRWRGPGHRLLAPASRAPPSASHLIAAAEVVRRVHEPDREDAHVSRAPSPLSGGAPRASGTQRTPHQLALREQGCGRTPTPKARSSRHCVPASSPPVASGRVRRTTAAAASVGTTALADVDKRARAPNRRRM